jgi:hypothetical protein
VGQQHLYKSVEECKRGLLAKANAAELAREAVQACGDPPFKFADAGVPAGDLALYRGPHERTCALVPILGYCRLYAFRQGSVDPKPATDYFGTLLSFHTRNATESGRYDSPLRDVARSVHWCARENIMQGRRLSPGISPPLQRSFMFHYAYFSGCIGV